MGENTSKFKGAALPVEKVSWGDAMEFCKKLTEVEKEANHVLRRSDRSQTDS